MPFGFAIGSVAAPVVGGLLGRALSSGDREKAAQLQAQAVSEIQNAPTYEARQLALQKYTVSGVLTPELANSIPIGASQVAGISENQGVLNAQKQALGQMQQRAAGGLSPADRAAYNQLRAQVAAETEGKRQQIMQNMQARGQGGSGAELAQALAASQGGSNQSAAGGDQISAQASQAALQALGQSGTMAGNIRSQDFANALAKGQASDEFARFNVQNQRDIQNANIAAKNQAQAANLQNAQGISNENVGTYNTEQQNYEARRQQAAQMAFNKALAAANAMTGQASNLQNQAAGTAQAYSGMGAGVGAGLGALGAYQAKQAANTPAPSAAVTDFRNQSQYRNYSPTSESYDETKNQA